MTKLIYTIEFEAPEEARVAECLYLIQGIRQEAQDRLPQDWKVRMRFALGVVDGVCPTTTPSSLSSTQATPRSTPSSRS